ncbi:MAG: UDP-N-acetylglucosamine pyrophosphorylase [Clostridia bacterium]|nr:UDP-N-acetylglucosamine pyrophosphorylase [Clostridia bacterium]
MEYDINSLFDISRTVARRLFEEAASPHEILGKIRGFLLALGDTLDKREFFSPKENIWIHKSARVSESAHVGAPCFIDEGAEIRPFAFIRGDAVIGKGAVVGNSTEIKNAVVFDGAAAPHYNYIGDSIVGYKAHLGAGVIISNLKSDGSDVFIKTSPPVDTGRRKVGAFVGDGAEIGCSAVLCPGTVVGRNAVIYPLVRVRGVVPENSIMKSENEIVKRK